MSGGGTKTQETVQTTEPWGAQKPYIEKAFPIAEREILDRPMEFFPGQTYVDYSDPTRQAMEGITERAGGSPLVGGAQEELMRTIRGDYLSEGNPYMDAVTQNVASQVLPQVQGAFARGGRSGMSPLAQEAAARGMTEALAPYQFGAYADERARQQQAAGMAPTLAAEDYRDLAALQQVGGMEEAKERERLGEEMQRFYFGQDEPASRLERYLRLVSGAYGGQTTGEQLVPQANPFMQGLGALFTGAGAAGGLGWRPFG